MLQLNESQLQEITDTLVAIAQGIATEQSPTSLLTTLVCVTLPAGNQPVLDVIHLEFADTHDKQTKLYLAGVAAGLAGTPVAAVLLSTEAWTVSTNEAEVAAAGGLRQFMGGLSPSEHPKRREIFLVTGLTQDGRSGSVTCEIKRDGQGRIVALLADPAHARAWHTPDAAEAQTNHLLPLFFVGERKARQLLRQGTV